MKKTILLVLFLALGLAAKIANADFTFGTPTNLGPTVNSSAGEIGLSISEDGLELYFGSDRAGGVGGWDIWVSTRPSKEANWTAPVNVGSPVNSTHADICPSISSDRLSLYFSDGLPWNTGRPGGYGWGDIWVATRPTISSAWGTPANLGSRINKGNANETAPRISVDGLSLFYTSWPYGEHMDIMMATRQSTSDPWGYPAPISSVNTSQYEWAASIESDGLALFFSRAPSIPPMWTIWMATRTTTSEAFGAPIRLSSTINDSYVEGPGTCCISPDFSALYFISARPGGVGDYDIWQVPIISIVDLNGDGIVDIKDLLRLIQSWGQDDPLVDIAPPFGDGVVDVLDLELLMSYWGQPVDDPTLIAHWALDETEGIVAVDSSGDNDAYITGDPVWQPSGGQVDGAIQLDGVDDCVITGSIPNPTEGSFSVFAWVKGGASGQVVLSQMGGARWLCADPSDGNLMTEIKVTGRGANELMSQTIIADGNWHRIGLVWDGSHRTLYVDGVAVAEDAQTNLEASENGLYIGTGKTMEPGSFWSGLIDDVRIYNRAVTP